jgi:2-polyprenyl-3-methyl-5-hydroxy-6-metoxy-1,4-benzoquinol methylase
MKFFKTGYNESYFNTIVELNPFFKKEIKQKVQLIELYKKHGDLLEIGCGDGFLLNKIKDKYNITGIDISEFAIKRASKLIDDNKLKILDIEKQDVDGDFDIIIAFDVMEHLKDPTETIKKIKNALKKDGIFIFSVPNNYGIFGKIMTKIFNFIDKTHISTYEREKWIQILKDNKFNAEIINHGLFGYQRREFAKYFSFNLVLVAQL